MADWVTSGNSQTAPPNDFLGTTDNEPLVIKTAGIERLRINALGQVGVGTSNPEAPLSILGPTLPLNRSAEVPLASFGFLSGNYSRLGMVARRVSDGDSWTTTSIGLRMDVDITKGAGSSIYLNANGNVGINTATPEAPLSVQGGSLGSADGNEVRLSSLGFFPGGGNYSRLGIVAQRIAAGDGWTTAAIGLQMDVDNVPRSGAHLWLHPNGNVGIGTSNPEANLAVWGDNLGAARGSELRLASFAFSSGNYSRLGVYARRFNAGASWATTAIGLGMDVDIATRVGGAIWLDANGGVGIGTEAQQAASYPLTRLTIIGQLPEHKIPLHAAALSEAPAAGIVGESLTGPGVLSFTYDGQTPGIYGFNLDVGPGITGVGRADVDLARQHQNFGLFGTLDNAPNTNLPQPPSPTGYGAGVLGFVGEGTGVAGVSGGMNDGGDVNNSNAVSGDFWGQGGAAIHGVARSVGGTAIYGKNVAGGAAGQFIGDVQIAGVLSATVKQFKIDHPLDPANKYLNHWSVESDEVLTIYCGLAETDDSGEAEVTLPAYIPALNTNYRYQLTSLGTQATCYVKREIIDGDFVIATDRPNVRVSWQIACQRRDTYLASRIVAVEEEKPLHERGAYLHPPADKEQARRVGEISSIFGSAAIERRSADIREFTGLDRRSTTRDLDQ